MRPLGIGKYQKWNFRREKTKFANPYLQYLLVLVDWPPLLPSIEVKIMKILGKIFEIVLTPVERGH